MASNGVMTTQPGVRRLTPTIGAVVENVDLSKPLAHEEIAAIRAALLAHKVIFFEDQHITATEQRDFAARFGALHTHPLYPGVPDAPELFILDNHAQNPTDNDAWHTDVTFIETPPLGAILYAKLLPPEGGDTIWSNMQAAFEGLSKPLQSFLSGLDAVHDFARGFPARGTVAKGAGADKHAKAVEEHPPVVHPVIRTHPETGADGIFVNFGFTSKIVGTPAQGERRAPELPVRARHQARVSGALEVAAELDRVLGQPGDPALRGERLPAPAPRDAPRDDPRRPPVPPLAPAGLTAGKRLAAPDHDHLVVRLGREPPRRVGVELRTARDQERVEVRRRTPGCGSGSARCSGGRATARV